MTHDQFKTKYLNTQLDWDATAGYQCADVAKAYADQVWGVRVRPFGVGHTVGGVINAFYNYPDSFIYEDEVELIKNNRSDVNQIPNQGDIIIWDYVPALTTKFGHIAVVDEADKTGFTSIDQNWGTDRVKMIRHSWDGILGWLKPRNQNNNIMNKDNLIQSINNNPQFDEPTRVGLVQSVLRDDAGYLLAFSGSSVRANLAEVKKELEALKTEQPQAAVAVEQFDSSLLWLGRLKSYLRSNVDKAVLVSSLTPIIIALNEQYQLGLDNATITAAILGFAGFLVSIGAIGEKLNK